MFYLVEINKEQNDTYSQGIQRYDTLDAASIAFHQSAAYAMSNENVLSMGRVIIDETMMPVVPMQVQVWQRTQPNE